VFDSQSNIRFIRNKTKYRCSLYPIIFSLTLKIKLFGLDNNLLFDISFNAIEPTPPKKYLPFFSLFYFLFFSFSLTQSNIDLIVMKIKDNKTTYLSSYERV